MVGSPANSPQSCAETPVRIIVEPYRRRHFYHRASLSRRIQRLSDFPGFGPCIARRYPRASAVSRKDPRNRLPRHCREMGEAQGERNVFVDVLVHLPIGKKKPASERSSSLAAVKRSGVTAKPEVVVAFTPERLTAARE